MDFWRSRKIAVALPERKRCMDLLVTREFKNELIELDKVFKATINPWWDSTYFYYQGIVCDITWKALPPVVYAAYKYIGCEDKFLTFTNIFRTAYFAHYIHSAVKDAEEGQVHNRDLQFNILIGDYFFGKLLKLLVDANNKKILIPFADMICSMNEGMIIKHKFNIQEIEALEKTKASVYTMVFLSAAINGEKDDEFSDLYKKMGFYLGMCIELSTNTNLHEKALYYLFNAEEIFNNINKEYRNKNSMLENIINDLRHRLENNAVAVAAVI